MKDSSHMTEAEHRYYEQQYEEAVEARDRKRLGGLQILATLQPHEPANGWMRWHGQVGQG